MLWLHALTLQMGRWPVLAEALIMHMGSDVKI